AYGSAGAEDGVDDWPPMEEPVDLGCDEPDEPAKPGSPPVALSEGTASRSVTSHRPARASIDSANWLVVNLSAPPSWRSRAVARTDIYVPYATASAAGGASVVAFMSATSTESAIGGSTGRSAGSVAELREISPA